MFERLAFSPADILLPQNCEYRKWSVVACDQYTSQPEYWQRVEDYVGSAPSSLRLILPESCLEGPDVETDIMEVNNTMTRYLRDGVFKALPGAMVYVERGLTNGRTRSGLVGMVDLEQYDYEPGSDASVRATEGTVLSRIPPRVAVRKNAPIELPHVLLLTDDPDRTVIEPLAEEKGRLEPLYDFDLMESGGHLSGWLLDGAALERVSDALQALTDGASIQFAVGDGNHSLATAKECYERQKRLTPPEKWADLPARYALCELVNLHDEALDFEPIHRVVFGVEPEALLNELIAAHPGARYGLGEGHVLCFLHRDGVGTVTVPDPRLRLSVGTLQAFLDSYAQRHKCRIDYIHGENVARSLGVQEGNLAFLLPAMDKTDLFPTVAQDGLLPRKTFSMGEASDKRFYLEARRIRG
ncbi:conserved hypothetical protein [uncultured Eubacteriales bacterium]|uniref:DUF1015 domain-containing protein n=1 Tax=uncultured Eubacteriales bacterium TaxID=172733 RepID=A0A212K5S4_9FIRM|nr:conserved hypothetical protein [uncultured Eubacteriales bacterium]